MGVHADIAAELDRGTPLEEISAVRQNRDYFYRDADEMHDHARKRVMKGVVGCYPVGKFERRMRLARRVRTEQSAAGV